MKDEKAPKVPPLPPPFTSLSARVWQEQMEIIVKAAKALSLREGSDISVGEYVRRAVMPRAFIDAGVKPKEFPPFARGGGKSHKADVVAAKLGMDRKEWERAIIESASAAAYSKLFDEEDEEPDRKVIKSEVTGLTPPPSAPVIRRRKKA